MNKLFTILISLVLLNTSCTKPVTLIRPIEIAPFIQPIRADPVKLQEVTFTTFTGYPLGSQIRRSELVLNDEGIYTYQGKIVVATLLTNASKAITVLVYFTTSLIYQQTTIIIVIMMRLQLFTKAQNMRRLLLIVVVPVQPITMVKVNNELTFLVADDYQHK